MHRLGLVHLQQCRVARIAQQVRLCGGGKLGAVGHRLVEHGVDLQCIAGVIENMVELHVGFLCGGGDHHLGGGQALKVDGSFYGFGADDWFGISGGCLQQGDAVLHLRSPRAQCAHCCGARTGMSGLQRAAQQRRMHVLMLGAHP